VANVVYIACSLDGFIAKSDGNMGWLINIPNESGSDYGFSSFLSGIDAIIMGRNTFETALGFSEWPYSKPVFVLSNSMKTVPVKAKLKAELVSGNLKEIITSLHKRQLNNIYIDGGKTIQSFLKEDLIDEMTVTTVSKIIGSGIPLFGSILKERHFKALKTELLNEFLVKTKYVRVI